jgi:hypothetical protein
MHAEDVKGLKLWDMQNYVGYQLFHSCLNQRKFVYDYMRL